MCVLSGLFFLPESLETRQSAELLSLRPWLLATSCYTVVSLLELQVRTNCHKLFQKQPTRTTYGLDSYLRATSSICPTSLPGCKPITGATTYDLTQYPTHAIYVSLKLLSQIFKILLLHFKGFYLFFRAILSLILLPHLRFLF